MAKHTDRKAPPPKQPPSRPASTPRPSVRQNAKGKNRLPDMTISVREREGGYETRRRIMAIWVEQWPDGAQKLQAALDKDVAEIVFADGTILSRDSVWGDAKDWTGSLQPRSE